MNAFEFALAASAVAVLAFGAGAAVGAWFRDRACSRTERFFIDAMKNPPTEDAADWWKRDGAEGEQD